MTAPQPGASTGAPAGMPGALRRALRHLTRTVPRLTLERCTVERCRGAGCTACVKACPVDAVLLDPGPRFLESCTGCGACLPACPNDALDLDGASEGDLLREVGDRVARGERSIRFACAASTSPAARVVRLPSLHRLTEALLLWPLARGAARSVVQACSCAICRRREGPGRIGGTLSRARALLRACGGDEGSIVEESAPAVAEPSPKGFAPVEGPAREESVPDAGVTRRHAFRSFLVEAGRILAPVVGAPDATPPSHDSRPGGARDGRGLVPSPRWIALHEAACRLAAACPTHAAPPDRPGGGRAGGGEGGEGPGGSEDPAGGDAASSCGSPLVTGRVRVGAACDGCGACVVLCPTGALALDPPAGASRALRLEPWRCTACGVCAGVCPARVVEVVPEVDPRRLARRDERVLVRLRQGSCPSCGQKGWSGNPGQACPGCRQWGGSLRMIPPADHRTPPGGLPGAQR